MQREYDRYFCSFYYYFFFLSTAVWLSWYECANHAHRQVIINLLENHILKYKGVVIIIFFYEKLHNPFLKIVFEIKFEF